MKIATNTLVTIFVIGLLAMSAPTASAMSGISSAHERNISRLERIYRHHDRKMELRASVLGLSPAKLKDELKTATYDQILKRHGFKSRLAFHTAALGKVKDELKNRGWNDKKITGYLQKRVERLNRG